MTSRQEARQEIRNALDEIVQAEFTEAMEAHRLHINDIMHAQCDRAACRCPYCGCASDDPFCCEPYDPWEFDPFED